MDEDWLQKAFGTGRTGGVVSGKLVTTIFLFLETPSRLYVCQSCRWCICLASNASIWLITVIDHK